MIKNTKILWLSLILPISFIGWSLGLIVQVHALQTEVEAKVGLINLCKMAQQNGNSVISLLSQPLEGSSVDLLQSSFKHHVKELAERANNLEQSGCHSDKCRVSLTHIRALHHMLKNNTSESIWLESGLAYRRAGVTLSNKMIGSLDHTIADLRRSLSSISSQMGSKWKQVNVIVIIACLLTCLTVVLLILNKRNLTRATQAREEMEKALEVRTRFLQNMGHELRTPIHGILSMNHLLSLDDIEENQRQYRARIEESAESLLKLLDNILEYSAIISGTHEISTSRFDLYHALNLIKGRTEAKVGKKPVDVLLNVQGDVPQHVIGYENGLITTLEHVLDNAVKFTEEGAININVGCTLSETQLILQISIRDTGVGISKNDLEGISEAFTQADDSLIRRHGGIGLGLTITHKMLSALGGNMEIKSERGKGTDIYYTLPFEIAVDFNVVSESLVSPIDLQYLYEAAAGDEDFVIEMVTSFLNNHRQTLKTMIEQFHKGDLKLLEESAHLMVSTFSYVGAKQLEAITREIKQLAQEGAPVQNIRDRIELLQAESEKVFELLEKERNKLLKTKQKSPS